MSGDAPGCSRWCGTSVQRDRSPRGRLRCAWAAGGSAEITVEDTAPASRPAFPTCSSFSGRATFPTRARTAGWASARFWCTCGDARGHRARGQPVSSAGAVFTVRLSLATTSRPRRRRWFTAAPPGPAAARRLRVLIADRGAEVREVLAESCGRRGRTCSVERSRGAGGGRGERPTCSSSS